MIGFTSVAAAAFHNIRFAKCAGFMPMHHNCLQRSRAAWTALDIGVGWVRVVIHYIHYSRASLKINVVAEKIADKR
jgi:hypothetical protein